MKQVLVQRPRPKPVLQPLDLRTPAGRQLPY